MNVGDDLADAGLEFPSDCSISLREAVILIKQPPMPARDAYHQIVRTALEKESWQITHDPLRLVLGRRKGYVDLVAEKLLAAQRGTRKIAVEIKSFLGASTLDELEPGRRYGCSRSVFNLQSGPRSRRA